MPRGSKIGGTAYGNVYFIAEDRNADLSLHLHELAHVVQARILGLESFLYAYGAEVILHGYRKSRLEIPVYEMQMEFQLRSEPFDVAGRVLDQLTRLRLV
jgi:hypothetical protein